MKERDKIGIYKSRVHLYAPKGNKTMTHYEQLYKALLPVHESTVKQYEVLTKKYDDILALTKQYSEHMEYCLRTLENENTLLKEKINTLTGANT